MSLINDMLKELEQRTSKINGMDTSVINLQAHANAVLKKNNYFYILLIGLLVGISVLLSIVLWHKQKSKYLLSNSKAQVAHVVISPAPVDQASLSADITPHLLTGVALQVEQEQSSLRFLLNQTTLYNLSYNVSRNELEIVLDHTNLLAALPKINFMGSGIENIQAFNDEQGNLKLVLSLSPSSELKHIALNEEVKSPELIVEISNKPISIAPIAQADNTIPVTVNNPIVENKTEQQFQRAIQLSSAGNDTQAIQLLSSLLEDYPAYNQGREFLIRLLVRQGNHEEANKVLNEGFVLQPTSAVYSELKARMLIEDGKLNQAVNLLEKNAPSLTNNPDYHAFIAALYQRQGKTSLAANLYKQLLALEPENAKWWLGLGVALDAMGNHGQAIEAYNNADTVGNLSPELKAYVESQLHTA